MLSFLYPPFLNSVLYLYQHLGENLALAIILFTVAVKLALAWPTNSFIRSQRKMQELQPKLQAIKQQYKNDREKQAKATMNLYKSSKVNPFSSCLPTLIQIPIFYGLYLVFAQGLRADPSTHLLIPDVLQHLSGSIRAFFEVNAIKTQVFPGFDLAQKGIAAATIILALLAGALQYWQSKMLTVKAPPKVPGAQDESFAAMTSKQMTYLFPFLTVFIVITLPAGWGLYWVISTAFSIVQQYIVLRPKPTTGGIPDHAPDAPSTS